MKSALFYEKLEDERIRCQLCPRDCELKPGQRGYCRGRKNETGELISTIYAQVSSMAMDPIEKKPLYHFYPGSNILSVGTTGCNLGCRFCQNWHIAQEEAPTEEVASEHLVAIAREHRSIGIAFTYSEPLIWYEYILDTARLAKEEGLQNVLVTNGLINPEPLEELLQYIDAINLDVKAFSHEFYRDVCGGGFLDTIKKTAELAAQACHLEVTTLLVPGLNDSSSEIKELVKWLSGLSADIPLHFSRYFPQFKMDLPPTPMEVMNQAKEIAGDYLHYVYLGNLPVEDRNTYCHHCRYQVVRRDGHVKVDLQDGACPECGTPIPIIY